MRSEFLIHFDGAGTPTTPAGWGWVMYQVLPDGNVELGSNSGALPPGSSSNVAEYTALLNAARAAVIINTEAKKMGVENMPIFHFKGDSKLVIKQCLGGWKCKEPTLQELRDQTLCQLHQLDAFTLTWVPREMNARADEIAALGKAKAMSAL